MAGTVQIGKNKVIAPVSGHLRIVAKSIAIHKWYVTLASKISLYATESFFTWDKVQAGRREPKSL